MAIPPIQFNNCLQSSSELGDYYIQKQIDEGDFREAINQLLSRLRLGNFSDLQKTYHHLIHLIPHFDGNDLKKLLEEERLSNLLKHPSDKKEQQDLALTLANWYVKQVNASSY